MLVQNPETLDAENDARLRVVRYYSDICSELVPDEVRQAHIEQVRELEAKTDEELAELGLLRDEIIDHVFAEAHYV